MIIPPFLKAKDQIRIISPSGKIDPKYIDGAANVLNDWGFDAVIGKNAKSSFGRFGGTVEERLSDLIDAFEDSAVKAILCSRGGYGIIHLLDKISPEVIRNNPKWLIGYSDVTALHALMQTYGVASIHAHMARHLCEASDFSTDSFRNILLGNLPVYQFESHPLNRPGECNGVLRGGNLSVLMGLRGTPFDFDAENTILFIEDIGEEPYHIERMLFNLKLSGVLSRLSGLIVGQFTDYKEDDQMMKSLVEVIFELVSEYNYPVAFNFSVGHVDANYPMLCGFNTQLKIGKNPSLSFLLSE